MFAGRYPLNKDIVAKETTRYSKGSYQKAKELLGWEPNTSSDRDWETGQRLYLGQ